MSPQDILRRMLATLAFRVQHALKNAPAGFENYQAGREVRTPNQIMNHLHGMLVVTDQFYRGEKATPSKLLSWTKVVTSFHTALENLDGSLEKAPPPDDDTLMRLFQGPFCDAMTHAGQLMMLRRMAGSAVPGANYFRAEIQSGRVGPDQALPDN